MRKKNIALPVVLGNMFSWFDFALYAFFAPVLSKVFFHTSKHSEALLLYFAVFAIGFFFRPIGASIWGYIADNYGRKRALQGTVIVMGLSTFLIGCLPSYDTAGFVSPMLLTILRIIQTMGISGEPSNSSTYMVESAPQGKRGYTGSLVMTGIFLGFFLGITAVTLVTINETTIDLLTWGWRIPFLASIVIAVLVYFFLTRADESPVFLQYRRDKSLHNDKAKQETSTVRKQYRNIFMAFGVTIMMAIGNYTILGFLSQILKGNLTGKAGLDQVNIALCVGMFVALILIPFMGMLSDRIGRRPVMMIGAIGFIVLIYPIYLLCSTQYNLLGMVLYGIILAPVSAMVPTTTTEMFPTSVRASGSAVGYSLALSVFGGTAPFVQTALHSINGSLLLPALYVMLIAIVHFLFILKFKETYKKDL